MFVHDFAYVDRPAAEVRELLQRGGGAWLLPLAVAAAADGERLRVRLGPLGAIPVIGKTYSVDVGDAYVRNDVVVLPLTWQATAVPGAFPVLRADLEVAGLGDALTQISLLGRYQPPLGALGRRLDDLLLHRIAEASIRSFLQRLAAELGHPGSGGPVPADQAGPFARSA